MKLSAEIQAIHRASRGTYESESRDAQMFAAWGALSWRGTTPAGSKIELVVEDDDRLTRDALMTADLPPWFRMVIAPAGRIRTKPRALNIALDQCRGTIVGVYDAEDAPEPDQIRKVVDRFHARGPDLACLQGRLDFYNPRVNWFSRCFTIEYAAWFRLLLAVLLDQRLKTALDFLRIGQQLQGLDEGAAARLTGVNDAHVRS